jgi:hypothetical protein
MNILEALQKVDVAELSRQRSEMRAEVFRIERDVKALSLAITAAIQAQVTVPGTEAKSESNTQQYAIAEIPSVVVETPIAREVQAVESPLVVEAPVAQEAVKEWEPEPIPIVPKKVAKAVAPCGKKIEVQSVGEPVALTIADRAKLYLESTDFASTMALVAFLGLPDGRTLNTMLAADSRFMQDKRGFWGLAR